jgi:hypothetical protein
MTPQFTPALPIHTTSRSLGTAACLLAATASALLLFFAVAPPATAQTPTLVVVRAMPVKAKKSEAFPPQAPLTKSDIGEVKVGGKVAPVT